MSNITAIDGTAGSGKTTYLKGEIAVLLSKGYTPEDFCICTYSRRLKEKWQAEIGWGASDDFNGSRESQGTIGTIHGICRRIAMINHVVDDANRAKFCKEHNLSFKQNKRSSYEMIDDFGTPVLKSVQHIGNLFFDARSFITNNMFTADSITNYNGFDDMSTLVFNPVAFYKQTDREFTAWKEENDCFDYDDMLSLAYASGIPPLGEILMVDEYQDVTPLQDAIIRQWLPHFESVYLAGDPRQMIGGYRGASSQFFKQFLEDPAVKRITLIKSFRLPDRVWDYSKNILLNANIPIPNMEKNGRQGNVKAITEDEYYNIIGDDQYTHDTYHLVRTNMMGQKIAHALMESGVPFDDVNMGWDIEQKSLYSILLKLRNLNTQPQVFREPEIIALMNAYPAEMFSASDKKIWKYLKKYSQPYPFSIIKNISRKDIFGERELWKTIRSDDPLIEANPEYTKKGSRRSKILNALRRGLPLHARPVRISTIHGAKGGEARNVFLHDAITKDIAHVLDVPYNRQLVEAEANIFFTGATRTLETLFMVNTHSKYRYGMPRLEVA